MTRLLFLLLGVKMGLFGAFYEASTIEEMAPHFENLEVGSLALFDADMVLSEPENLAFRYPTMKAHRGKAKGFMEGLTPGENAQFLSYIAINSGRRHVEEGMPDFINKLTEKGVKTICLTACLAGPLDGMASMSWWRLENLTAMGYDFSRSFPQHEQIDFVQFPEFAGGHPQFLRGILVANGGVGACSKGNVLKAFFQAIRWRPTKVVFIDDRLENLEDVAEALRMLDPKIEFVGIHYTASMKKECPAITEEAFAKQWEAIRAKISLSKK